MLSKIHNTSYLLAEEIHLSQLKESQTKIFELKQGYEIIHVSVEIETQGNNTLDLGITEAQDFFLNDIDLSTKGIFKSKVEATIKADTSLTLTTDSRDGIIKVRVLYFTPGRIDK